MEVRAIASFEFLPTKEEDRHVVLYTTPLRQISYRTELSGKTARLKALLKVSEKFGGLLVCPFDTDNYGIVRHSAGVFDNGRLLGITDMTVAYEDSPYMPGRGGRLFDSGAGKIAVGVGDDLYSYDLMRAYAVCGAEAVFVMKSDPLSEADKIVVRAYSYLLGIPITLCAKGYVFSSDFKGETVAEGSGPIDFAVTPVAEYHLAFTRTRFNK